LANRFLLKVAGFQAPTGGWVWAPLDSLEEATGILRSNPDAPVDLAAVSCVITIVGEAVCVRLEKNHKELLACQDRLESILEVQRAVSQNPAKASGGSGCAASYPEESSRHMEADVDQGSSSVTLPAPSRCGSRSKNNNDADVE